MVRVGYLIFMATREGFEDLGVSIGTAWGVSRDCGHSTPILLTPVSLRPQALLCPVHMLECLSSVFHLIFSRKSRRDFRKHNESWCVVRCVEASVAQVHTYFCLVPVGLPDFIGPSYTLLQSHWPRWLPFSFRFPNLISFSVPGLVLAVLS